MSDLKGKRLLLLGGIRLIKNIVLRAQELGVYVIVTDYLADSPAKQIADESYPISTTDVDAVVALAKRLKVDGVFTAYIDSMLTYCRQVCDRLNLPFYATAEQIDIMTNKDKFKKICVDHGLQVVKEYDLPDRLDDEKLSLIQYPVVVKPVDYSGGKGIFVCETEKELQERYLDSLSYSKRKKVLVEEYMYGQQVQIYYTIQDGYVSLSAMSDRYTNKEQRGVAPLPAAHIFPSKYLTVYNNMDHQKAVNLFNSMNIKNGVLFCQAFMYKDRAHIHDIGFRYSGSQGHKVIRELNEIDTVEMMIRHALTGKMKGYSIKDMDKPDFDMWVCRLYIIARRGRIAKIKGFDKIITLPEVFDITPAHDEGDTITQFGTLDQVVSRIFIKAKTINQLADVIEEIKATIQVDDEKGENMLLDLFDTNELFE